jgi:hypothetical protein
VAEFVQRRFRQAVNARLAVVPLRQLGHHQQVTPRLEAVFEWLAPGELDGFRLKSIPGCDLTARDVGWSNLNDGARRARRTGVQLAHNRAS